MPQKNAVVRNFPEPYLKRWTPRTDVEIVETYLEKYPTCESHSACVTHIARYLNVPEEVAERAIRKAALRDKADLFCKELKEEIWKDRIPLLKEVGALSLTAVRDFLLELVNNENKRNHLSVRDAKDLTTIAKDLNEMLRLDLGQSTQNIEIQQYTHDQAIKVIAHLKEIDPVFEYPDEEIISGTDVSDKTTQ